MHRLTFEGLFRESEVKPCNRWYKKIHWKVEIVFKKKQVLLKKIGWLVGVFFCHKVIFLIFWFFWVSFGSCYIIWEIMRGISLLFNYFWNYFYLANWNPIFFSALACICMLAMNSPFSNNPYNNMLEGTFLWSLKFFLHCYCFRASCACFLILESLLSITHF